MAGGTKCKNKVSARAQLHPDPMRYPGVEMAPYRCSHLEGRGQTFVSLVNKSMAVGPARLVESGLRWEL